MAGVKQRPRPAPGQARDDDNSPQAWREAMQALGHGRDVHQGFGDPVILDFDRLKAEAAKKRSA